MMHTKIPKLVAAITILSSCFFTGSSLADSDEEGYAGQPGAVSSNAGSTVLFDNSESFVPPSELPIADEYVKESLGMSQEASREEQTAVSVTPDGEVELLPPDDGEVQAMREAIQNFQANGGQEDTPALQPSAEGANEVSEDFEKGSVRAETVIGADTRVRITATKKYPFRTVGRIDIGCTGTLIGPRHVLTAGHCVYNIRTDKWYSNLAFSPGQNGSSRPWGKIAWKRAISVKGWTKSHKRNYDYAMIVLSKDIGKTVGWMGYGWKNPLPKYNVNINGYPGDKPFGTMWHSYCKLKIVTTFRLYYPCDTAGGMSGSGVYVYFSSSKKRIIYGIHAYGVDGTGYNGATRIRKAVFENLKKWKAKY